jgi:hypothetical protein
MPQEPEHEYDRQDIDARSFLELVRRDPTVPLATRIKVAEMLIQLFGDEPWPPRISCYIHIGGLPDHPPMGIQPSRLEPEARTQ